MRIQNNITALNTHRQYTINNDNVAKNAEKLSSGYRINRAGDDAAGLAISEKMRSQIRGLNMATKNSQDAISLVQTAEGALQETHSMLQRMNELAVQAATGTNQETDRIALAKEFEQLKREINDVAETTTFNNMKILDGSLSYKGYERSAATAGVTVTRPTKFDGQTAAAAGSNPVLGATITGLDLSKDKTVDIDGGKSVTITATYTDTDGQEQKLEFKATNTQAAGTASDIDTLLQDATGAGTAANGKLEGPEGWSLQYDSTSGKVTLINTSGDLKMDENTQVSISVSTNDTAAAAKLETPEVKEANLELVQAKEAEKATVSIDVSNTNTGGVNTAVSIGVKINGEDFTVEVSRATGNWSNNTALSTQLAGQTITVKDAAGNPTDAWTASVDANNKIVLTAKEAPATEADAKAPEVTVSAPTGGTTGTPTATATSAAGAPAKSTGNATAATITGASAGTAVAANGEKAVIKMTIGDEEVTFTSSEKAVTGTKDSFAALFADGVTSSDGKWTLKTAADGKITVTATETGEIKDLPTDVTFQLEDTGNPGTAITANAGTLTAKATNGTEAKATATGTPDVTTIEFGFDKMRDGDKFTINVGGKDIEITKEAGDTRDSFIKKLEDAVAANGYAEGTVKVSGTSIVVQDGVEVGEPALDASASTDLEKTTAMRIQVGALENEQLNIAIDSMNTKGLNLDGMNLETQDSAGKAITAVRAAVLKVADQRATLGAMQNRLDHKIANLKVTSENLSAAESRIRDVDMASEMTEFTKNNILSQAATAMLAQANALPQNVLSLLG